jgi:Rrf2 family protein
MILKSQVEWALHCCAILAGVPAGRYLSTKALAEFHGIPKEYLSKALQAVSQAALVEATLGPSGGYRLARPASEISFLDIVEAVEGRGRSFACTNIRDNNPCKLEGSCDDKPCAIARVMWEADEAWRQSLRAVRLSDLMKTLEEDLSPELRQNVAGWITTRAG